MWLNSLVEILEYTKDNYPASSVSFCDNMLVVNLSGRLTQEQRDNLPDRVTYKEFLEASYYQLYIV